MSCRREMSLSGVVSGGTGIDDRVLGVECMSLMRCMRAVMSMGFVSGLTGNDDRAHGGECMSLASFMMVAMVLMESVSG